MVKNIQAVPYNGVRMVYSNKFFEIIKIKFFFNEELDMQYRLYLDISVSRGVFVKKYTW